jgi:hypothetical protein
MESPCLHLEGENERRERRTAKTDEEEPKEEPVDDNGTTRSNRLQLQEALIVFGAFLATFATFGFTSA